MLNERGSSQLLGVVRILVFSLWFFNVLTVHLQDLAALPHEQLSRHGVLRLIPDAVWELLWSPAVLPGFQIVLLVLLAWLILGLRGYAVLAVLTVVLLTLFDGMAKSLGHINHSKMVMLLASYLVAAFPAADALSLRRGPALPERAHLYRAGVMMITVVMLLGYAFLGAYRLDKGGFEVYSGDAIKNWFLRRSYEQNPTGFTIGILVSENRAALFMAQVGFVITEFFEVTALLCLVFRRFRWAWMAWMIPFHVLSLLTMNIFFWQNVLLILVLLPDWDRVLAARRERALGGSDHRFDRPPPYIMAPPKFCLTWASFLGDCSISTRFRRSLGRAIWKQKTRLEARADFVLRQLAWPVVAVIDAINQTARFRQDAHRQVGKSAVRQLVEQIYLALRYTVPPIAYYTFGLYRDSHRREATHYVHRFETKGSGLYRVLRRRDRPHNLTNKISFSRIGRDHGLPTVPAVLEMWRGKVRWLDAEQGSLPHRDLFVKPVGGKGGNQTFRFDWVDADRYRDADGAILTERELMEQLKTLSMKDPMLVQPRVVNHRELKDLTNGALSTVRLMTVLNEKLEPEPVAAVFRMAIGDNHQIDNIHAGGIASPVDLDTGRLGRATGLSPGSDWHAKHPTSGAGIEGRELPHWREVVNLGVQAHRVFSTCYVVGWDIAITDDGPVLVEGNSSPCVVLIQRPHDAGLLKTRFGEIMVHHLADWSPERMSALGPHGGSAGIVM